MELTSTIFAVIGVIVGIVVAIKNGFGFFGFLIAIVIGYFAGAYIGVAFSNFVLWKENRRRKNIKPDKIRNGEK
jgi:hypothetical protein